MRFGFAHPQASRAEITRALTGNVVSYGGNAAPEAIRASGVWFQKEAAADSFLLTGDVNLIDFRAVIQYRIDDALKYLYGIADADALVRSTTLVALRRVVATHGVDATLTTARGELERQVAHAVQVNLDRYGAGIEVVSFRLLYVHPPDTVHDAFLDVASAQEDMLRTVNRAGIFAVEKVNEAKADAAALEEQASAARDRDIMHAKADAAAFALRLDAYHGAPELTRFRLQLETLGAVLPGVTKIVRPGAGEVKDFDLWLLQPPTAGGR
jgi:membrane protease subunit HflK